MKIVDCTENFILENIERFSYLYGENFKVHHPLKTNYGSEFFTEQMKKKASYIKENMGRVYAAVEGDTVLGFVHVYMKQFLDEKRITISDIIVDSESRGKRIGTSLFHKAEEYAKAEKCDAIEVLAINTENAVGFYHSVGFSDFRINMVKKI